MGLRFLEKDELIPYIADTLDTYKAAKVGGVYDLYKRGNRPALLIVDLQEAFTSPDSPMGTRGLNEELVQLVNGCVEKTAVLLDAVRRKGLPIVYATIVFNEEGSDGGVWGEKNPGLLEYCRRGSQWVEVDKRIAPRAGEYRIEKKVFSSFVGTPLHQILTYNRVDTCIVTGLSVSGCVRQTTIDAVSHGYYAVIPEECVGDRAVGPYKASLFDLMMKTADVASLKQVIDWIDKLTARQP
jgi:nicotinamidase-related amidase